MTMNPKDPLNQAHNAERQLFDAFAKTANGFQREQVVGAAINLVVNALRQTHSTQRKALDDFDMLTARVRALLAEHYDVLGRRRNIFPFHQTIEMPMFDARPKDVKPN